MGLSQTHIIRRQIVNVKLAGTELEGFDLQQRLLNLCRNWFPAVTEEILDQFAPQEGLLVIDRLEIDAGSISLQTFDKDFVETVKSAFENALRKEIPPGLKTGSTEIPVISRENIMFKSGQTLIEEALVHFLKTGRLPLTFSPPPEGTLEEMIFSSWGTKEKIQPGNFFKNELLKTLGESRARIRLSMQFTPAFQETLLKALSPDSLPEVKKILAWAASSGGSASFLKQISQATWQSAFNKVASGENATVANLLREFISSCSGQKISDEFLIEWEKFLKKIVPGDLPSDLPEKLLFPDSAKKPKGTEILKPGRSKKEGNSHEPSDSTKEAPKAAQENEELCEEETGRFLPVTNQSTDDAFDEGAYIKNAGLVLLHPFLPRFFSALGVAAEDHIIKPNRALALLHYLATGRTTAPEYELVLPKVLCNIALGAPVDPDIVLNTSEQAETVALLEAVIRHWKVLKNTSPDGLRGTFLLRSGKISTSEDDLLLQVERNGFDVLLDQLPWGISMIKLPWMKNILRVEWG